MEAPGGFSQEIAEQIAGFYANDVVEGLNDFEPDEEEDEDE